MACQKADNFICYQKDKMTQSSTNDYVVNVGKMDRLVAQGVVSNPYIPS